MAEGEPRARMGSCRVLESLGVVLSCIQRASLYVTESFSRSRRCSHDVRAGSGNVITLSRIKRCRYLEHSRNKVTSKNRLVDNVFRCTLTTFALSQLVFQHPCPTVEVCLTIQGPNNQRTLAWRGVAQIWLATGRDQANYSLSTFMHVDTMIVYKSRGVYVVR